MHPDAHTAVDLRHFADLLITASHILKEHGMYSEIDTQNLILSMCMKLQLPIRYKWRDHAKDKLQTSNAYPRFSDFVSFVERQADVLNDPVYSLRKELHWLPIEARPVFKILCYTYKAIHGNLPDYMCDLVSVYNPKRCGLRSGNSSIKRLCTVKANSAKYGYMCYSLAAPALWNPLPEDIRSAETFVTFKKSLKTFLFKKYLC